MLVPRSVSRRKPTRRPDLPSLASVHDIVAKQAASFAAAPVTNTSPAETLHVQHGNFMSHNDPDTGPAKDQKDCEGPPTSDVDELHNACSASSDCLRMDGANSLGRVSGPSLPLRDSNVHSTRPNHAPHLSTRMMANITGYQDSKRMAAMSSKDANKLRDSLEMHVDGKHIPKPIMSFEDCSLPDKMLSNLKDNGYIHPRGVQMQAVSAGLYGRDMIISAETGAGKTAGFLIPILVHAYGLSQSPAGALHGPFALILVPTRELAMQIEQVAKSIVKGMSNMRTALLVGGQAMANQAHRLKQNIQVAVATPGRMVDIFKQHPEIEFSNVFCLVLDEVDVMFSLGFGPQVKRILQVLPTPPNGRQTIVSSATLSKQIQRLTVKYMENALSIRIGDSKDQQVGSKFADVFSPSSNIKQTIMWVENESKKKQLFSLLKDPAYFRPPVLIFVESRVGADLLANAIRTKCPGINAISMHGEKAQEERSASLKLVEDGEVPVVVATGLLARGLTLNVATVINFDMAPTVQEYVHRVGRASPEAATKAAAGIRKGPKLGGMAWAITFINNDHRSILGDFATLLHGLGSGRVTPLPPQLQHLVVERIGKPAPPASPSTRDSTVHSALPLASKRKLPPTRLSPRGAHSRPDKWPKPS
ncbi:hypothetical protein KVV02_000801 [Mortierella alpina]|uniref:RNA helicase n=1 Tax=Mortierella alpina TaxID=64518 RepID=A0A9P8A0I2_MORAP|nr:hypothetical protein KVV02_000801 [Mortierella alpina]